MGGRPGYGASVMFFSRGFQHTFSFATDAKALDSVLIYPTRPLFVRTLSYPTSSGQPATSYLSLGTFQSKTQSKFQFTVQSRVQSPTFAPTRLQPKPSVGHSLIIPRLRGIIGGILRSQDHATSEHLVDPIICFKMWPTFTIEYY